MASKTEHGLLYQLAGSVLIVLLLGAAFWLFYARPMQPPQQALVIDRMHFSVDREAADSLSAGARTLPDDWLASPTAATRGWYSARFKAANPALPQDPLLAIYIPAIQMQAKVYLNGTLIGRSTATANMKNIADPLAREIHRPLYATFPHRLIVEGENDLQIQVNAYRPDSGLLGRVYIGSHRQLRSYYTSRLAARISTVQIISAGMLTIAIFMTVLWWLRRQDSIYGWFALLVYTWTLRNLLLIGYDTPLPAAAEDWLTLTTLGWFIVFMVVCTHRYMDMHPRKLEYALFAFTTIGTLVLGAAYLWNIQSLLAHRVWSTFALLLGSYALGQVALAYRYRDDLKNPFVPAGGLSILLLGAHDWLLVMGLIPRDNGLLLHFSAPVTLITFATLLLERFTAVLREAESLNLELENRVAEKHAELESNYKKLRQMETRQAIAEERERFMKEIHDGVGGHLISMLSMMRSGEKDTGKITRAIEASLSDLRIMIDSLDPEEHDIPALLGAMRSRLEPQLASSGMKFEWHVNAIPPLPDFGPRKALQVMRIVQEAITNILNHAEARLISIHARVETDENNRQQAVISVTDDGKGFTPGTDHGHGLNNMKQRAQSIQAKLDITSRRPGTRVQLSLPY